MLAYQTRICKILHSIKRESPEINHAMIIDYDDVGILAAISIHTLTIIILPLVNRTNSNGSTQTKTKIFPFNKCDKTLIHF